jgi:GDPmannose 4,6-dehydratase
MDTQTLDAPVALITGITGQDGSFLAELLLSKGYQVHGIVRRTSQLNRSRIEHLRTDPEIYNRRLFLHYGDLVDATTLRRIFQRVQPTEVYHLAGQSHVGLSFEIPESTCEEVANATLRLLEICRDQPKQVRVYHASSSEIFGQARDTPQTEQTAFRPSSPYGCAKAFATQIARVYREAHGMFVCNGILYNHESSRRGEGFVTRKISRAVASIKLGLEHQLVLGNVTGSRDWGHAEDYVLAMWMMLQHSEPDDYIVATGKARTVMDFVQAAFEVVDLPWREHLSCEESLSRKAEPTGLVGDSGKIARVLGWRPRMTFADIVRDMVESDLRALAAVEATAVSA